MNKEVNVDISLVVKEQVEVNILKNLIMGEFITQEDLKKVVKAMEKPIVEKRPQVNKEVETR